MVERWKEDGCLPSEMFQNGCQPTARITMEFDVANAQLYKYDCTYMQLQPRDHQRLSSICAVTTFNLVYFK